MNKRLVGDREKKRKSTLKKSVRDNDRVYFSSDEFNQVCNKSSTTDATNGAGTAYPSGAPEFIPGF